MKRNARVALALVSALILSACDSPSTPAPAGAAQAVPEIPVTKISADNFELAKAAKGFQVGMGAPAAVVFFDPQCPHCGDLWAAAKPLYAKAAIKWVPVGILNAKSETQAALLLASATPLTAMNAHEDAMRAHGSDVLVDVPTDAARGDARKNAQLMTGPLASTSIPTIVYLDPTTKQPSMVTGALPTDRLAKLLAVPYGVTAAEAPAAPAAPAAK